MQCLHLSDGDVRIFVICLSPLKFNGLFPGGPELAVTRMSPFWILLELRMMKVGGDNWSCKTCKELVSSCQQTNTQ